MLDTAFSGSKWNNASQTPNLYRRYKMIEIDNFEISAEEEHWIAIDAVIHDSLDDDISAE